MVDIGTLISQYFIEPIVSGDSYNVVNTVTYALILGISLFAVLKLMDIFKIKIDERFIIATSPYIVMGASLRVLEDVNLVTGPLSYLFITPFVYFLAFALTAAILLTCLLLERKGVIKDYSKPYFVAGIAGIVIVFCLLALKKAGADWTVLLALISLAFIVCLAAYFIARHFKLGFASVKPDAALSGALIAGLLVSFMALQRFSDRWWAPLVIISLAFTFTAAIYFIAKRFNATFLLIPLNVAILGAHMFDASSTFTAIDIITGFMEKHVVPTFFIDILNTSFVMYALKLAVFIPVIYIIEKYFKEDEQIYYAIKFVLLVLGFGPGIRNTLEITFI